MLLIPLQVINSFNVIGFIMLGLLYGEGNFEKSILSAVNCGYDTDCTAATAGAVMGILLGTKGIPERWRAPIGEKIKVNPRIIGINPPENLTALTEETLAVAKSLSLRGNLPVLPQPFILPKVEVTQPPFSFPFLLNRQPCHSEALAEESRNLVSFSDFHFNLNPYFDKTPGTVKLSTYIENPRTRKVRILPACNDGVRLCLDGNLILSHHEHTPIR